MSVEKERKSISQIPYNGTNNKSSVITSCIKVQRTNTARLITINSNVYLKHYNSLLKPSLIATEASCSTEPEKGFNGMEATSLNV
jgi:hypothetical protein